MNEVLTSVVRGDRLPPWSKSMRHLSVTLAKLEEQQINDNGDVLQEDYDAEHRWLVGIPRPKAPNDQRPGWCGYGDGLPGPSRPTDR